MQKPHKNWKQIPVGNRVISRVAWFRGIKNDNPGRSFGRIKLQRLELPTDHYRCAHCLNLCNTTLWYYLHTVHDPGTRMHEIDNRTV